MFKERNRARLFSCKSKALKVEIGKRNKRRNSNILKRNNER